MSKHYEHVMHILDFERLKKKRNQMEMKGHDCAWIWERRKFLIETWEHSQSQTHTGELRVAIVSILSKFHPTIIWQHPGMLLPTVT